MYAVARKAAFARFQHTWIKPEGFDTGIKVYNCISKQKVPFVVRDKNFVGWYTCGPTVYDSAHLGHATCYIKFDIIQRILKQHFNLNLVTVMNITDIDDKIIKRSQDMSKAWQEIAVEYEKEFWEDCESLKIRKPDAIVRVSEYVPVIQEFIKKLLQSKKAYEATDGSVYFDVNKHDSYGKLVNVTKENVINETNNFKRSQNDFVLWKNHKEGEPYWNSDFGPGRPGWHIECSTIAGTILGSTIDVHAGGIDLKFPHHENEETQSCAYFSQKQWVNYWMHSGHLHLKNTEKMSKSLKNSVTIRNFLQKHNAETLRVACLMSNYRNAMEYSDEVFVNAEKVLQSFKFFFSNCNAYVKGQLKAEINDEVLRKALSDAVFTINNALKDDFDTATALKSLHGLVTTVNKMLHSTTSNLDNNLHNIAPVIAILNYITRTFDLFGINLNSSILMNDESNEFLELLNILMNFRQNLRDIGISTKDSNILKLCDGVRNDIKKCGIAINDRGKISTWTK